MSQLIRSMLLRFTGARGRMAVSVFAAAGLAVAALALPTGDDPAPQVLGAVTGGTPVAGASLSDEATAGTAPTPAPAQAEAPGIVFSHAASIIDASAGRIEHLEGTAARDAGDHARAAERFGAAAAQGGLIAPVARYRQAQSLVQAGRRDAAVAVFVRVLAQDDLPESLRAGAVTEAAANLAALKQHHAALATLALIETAPGASAAVRAGALWDAARIRRDLGQPAWVEDARAAIALSTDFSGAPAAFDALAEASVPVPRIAAGVAYYRARRDADALRLLQASLDQRDPAPSAPDAARAWFYIGALRERATPAGDALAAYQRSIDLHPDGPLADDAHWWRASIYAYAGDVVAQVRELDRLVAAAPGSSFAAEARLRAAVEAGRAGRLAEALTRLEAITRGSSAAAAATAARWHAVFRGTPGAPGVTPLSPAAFDLTSFPAILERSGVDAQQPLAGGAWREVPVAPDAAADAEVARRWVAETLGAGEAAAGPDRTLALAFELAVAGEDRVSRRLFSTAVAARVGRPADLLQLAVEAGAAGLYDVQRQAAVTMLAPLGPQQRLAVPRAVLRFAYPVPYLGETVAASERFGVPPLLLFALVRQESGFHPRAGSSAGAYGLAQLMPATAEEVARQIGMPPPGSRLGDPATSLQLGASYLGTQLRFFDGNVPAALSAYNAGPGNAKRWLADYAPRNFDGLMWSTDFEETRRYLHHVLENYAWYRYIYAGSPLSIR